jgi:outer membrane protein assembly factor BamB
MKHGAAVDFATHFSAGRATRCGSAGFACGRGLIGAFALVLLASCGGGGGGGGGSGTTSGKTTLSVSTNSVSATDVSTDLNGPIASFSIYAQDPPSAGLYVNTVPTTHGIASVNFNSGTSTAASVEIVFKPAISLGVGVYSDTVAVDLCYDSACKQPVTGSPQTVNVTLTITQGNPATATPALSSISPTSVVARSAPVTLTVNGVNFATSSQVLWRTQFGATALATTFVSSTQLTAVIPTADLQGAGPEDILVTNQSTGGGTSSIATFTVSAIPMTLASVAPSSVPAGGSGFVATVTGSGFDTTSQVQWNGSGRATYYESPTQLAAQITASDIAGAGTASVAVYSGAFNTTSNAIAVPVASAPLALQSLWPAAVPAGTSAFGLSVIGTGFNASSTVQWNGVALATTPVSTTELTAQVPAADLLSAGSVPVTVVNSAPSSTSGSVSFTVAATTPDAVSYQVDQGHSGSVNFATMLPPASWPQAAAGTWSTAPLTGLPGTPLIAAGKVFVVSSYDPNTSSLVAFDQVTGNVAWGPVQLGGNTAIAYDNNLVFVTQASGTTLNLVAFSAATGAVQWTSPMSTQYIGGFAPIIAAAYGVVFAYRYSAPTYEFDEATGAPRLIVANTPELFGPVTVTPDGLYSSGNCGMFDVDPRTLAPIWSDGTCLGGPGFLPITVARGVAYAPYIPAGDPSDVGLDAHTGSIVNSIASTSVAVNATTAYYTAANLGAGTYSVQAVPLAGGSALWSFSGDGGLYGPPLVVNAPSPAASYGFASSGSGNLYAFNASTGAQVWQVTLAATSGGRSMNLGDGLLVVVNADNSLTAFRISNAP